jgi:hypothetical protein
MLRCQHGHVLTRYDIEPCDAHSGHRVYVCRMRRGQQACGDVVVLPQFTPACNDEDDEA